jgi:hypothetical protein
MTVTMAGRPGVGVRQFMPGNEWVMRVNLAARWRIQCRVEVTLPLTAASFVKKLKNGE